MKIKKMKKINLFLAAIVFASFSSFSMEPGKLVSSKTHIRFFSTTPAENIEANNYSSTSTINTATGDVVFSVPMQGFEFDKALMQKHFNGEDFLNTSAFPRAKFVGKITNLDAVDFAKDGTYAVNVKGEMSIKDVTKTIDEKGTIKVKGGAINAESTFNLTLADYGVTFLKGKPASNIAKTMEVTFHGEYDSQ